MADRHIPPRRETPHAFGTAAANVDRSLRELEIANRLCNGSRSVLRCLTPLIEELSTDAVSVLDVGSGSADIARELVTWGRRRGVSCHVCALDLHPRVIAHAAARSRAYSEITFVRGDVFSLPFATAAFDFVISSMLLHYFAFNDARRMLSALAGIAKRAVLIADVERHWFPIRAINALSRVSGDRLVRRGFNDTVLRGFTARELECLASRAGLHAYHVQRHVPFRLTLTARTT